MYDVVQQYVTSMAALDDLKDSDKPSSTTMTNALPQTGEEGSELSNALVTTNN